MKGELIAYRLCAGIGIFISVWLLCGDRFLLIPLTDTLHSESREIGKTEDKDGSIPDFVDHIMELF